jgi:uncharacterized iron-regulated membrane protein
MRRLLYNLHLWGGLIAGLLVVVLGISGTALVFRADIERFETRDWRTVVPVGAALPLDELIELARTAVPGKVLARVTLANSPDDSVQVFLQKPRAQNLKDAQLVNVFVDPYRGIVLGVRRTNEGWIWWLQDLHYALFAGEPGLKVNGVAAAVMFGLALTGPVLWWPGWRRRRDAFRVRARPAAAKWRDLHAVSGVVACLALAMISLTALYFAYRGAASAVVTLVAGNSARPPPTLAQPSADTPPSSLQQLVAVARAAIPEAHFDELRASRNGTSPASISFRLPGDFVFGRHRLFIDPYRAEVVRIDRFEELNAGAQMTGNMAPWHFGSFGGRVTQWIWFVLGLLPMFLFGSGLWLWLRRRNAGRTMR